MMNKQPVAVCPSCVSIRSLDDNNCGKCGADLMKACPSCSAPIEISMMEVAALDLRTTIGHCKQCGHRILA